MKLFLIGLRSDYI